METKKEILEYLKPYTEMVGIACDKLISVDCLGPNIFVTLDIKSAFPEEKSKQSICSWLKRNGFHYVPTSLYDGYYKR
jgi:hypothetical protein